MIAAPWLLSVAEPDLVSSTLGNTPTLSLDDRSRLGDKENSNFVTFGNTIGRV